MGVTAAAVTDAVATAAAGVGAGTAAGATVGALGPELVAPTLFGSELLATGVGTGLVGAGVGAGLGGIQAGITGNNIGQGILGGAAGGAVTGGFAPGLGNMVGSEIGGGVLGGALGGLANAGITGGNLGTGALTGGAAGGLSAAIGGGGSPTTPGTGGESAVATAAPAGVGGDAPPVDLTAGQGGSNWAQTNTSTDTGAVTSTTPSSGMQGSSSPTANLPQTGGDVPPAMVGASAGNAPQQGLWDRIASGAQDFFTPSNPTPVNVATDLGLPTAGTPYSGLPTTGNAAQGSDFNWGANTPATNPTVSTGANSVPQIGNVSPGMDQINANTNTLSAQNTPYATTSSGTNAPPPATAGGGQGGGAAPFDYGKSTVGSIANSLGIPENAITTAIAKNPGVAAGALGLGASAIMGQQQPKGYNQLNQEAQSLAAQGGQLQNALNGTLPAGAQAQLNQASNSAKSAMRSKFAQMGLTGSTMEAQSLANVDQQVAAEGFNMTMSLYNAGVQESGMADQLFRQIMQMNQAQSQGLSNAVSNFAGALAGGSNNGQSIRILAGNA